MPGGIGHPIGTTTPGFPETRAGNGEASMSNTVRLALALALTAVTATGALAASQHRGAHPRAYGGYAYSPDAAYGAPQFRSALAAGPQTYRRAHARTDRGYSNGLNAAYGAPARGWASAAPQAYWRSYAPAYTAYSNSLDTALGAPPYARYY
jgi:hypothetical protein